MATPVPDSKSIHPSIHPAHLKTSCSQPELIFPELFFVKWILDGWKGKREDEGLFPKLISIWKDGHLGVWSHQQRMVEKIVRAMQTTSRCFIFKIELSSFVCEENCFHHGSDKKYYRKQNCLHILCYSIILVLWEIFLSNFVKIFHFNFSLKAFNCLRNSSDVFDLYFEFRALAS